MKKLDLFIEKTIREARKNHYFNFSTILDCYPPATKRLLKNLFFVYEKIELSNLKSASNIFSLKAYSNVEINSFYHMLFNLIQREFIPLEITGCKVNRFGFNANYSFSLKKDIDAIDDVNFLDSVDRAITNVCYHMLFLVEQMFIEEAMPYLTYSIETFIDEVKENDLKIELFINKNVLFKNISNLNLPEFLNENKIKDILIGFNTAICKPTLLNKAQVDNIADKLFKNYYYNSCIAGLINEYFKALVKENYEAYYLINDKDGQFIIGENGVNFKNYGCLSFSRVLQMMKYSSTIERHPTFNNATFKEFTLLLGDGE